VFAKSRCESGTIVNQPRASADAGHVLLVLDDDSAVRQSLKFALEIEGFEVRTYASPSELLRDDDLPAFSCLIVDYHMPEMDGLNVITRLRERRTPLHAVLITSHPSASIRERARATGVPVIEKPFNADLLRATVAATVAAAEQRRTPR